MPNSSWKDQATVLAPLLRHAEVDGADGQQGVLKRVCSVLPRRAGFGVVIGQPNATKAGAACFEQIGWKGLRVQHNGAFPVSMPSAEGHAVAAQQCAGVSVATLGEVFEAHAVPKDLDCLVIDLRSLEYWVWEAIDATFVPSLVVVRFNPAVAKEVAATLQYGIDWKPGPGRDQGASWAALSDLAVRRGYRLIHVHGPNYLYFLREDIAFPGELTVKSPLEPAEFTLLVDRQGFDLALGSAGSGFGEASGPAPDVSRAPWELLAPPMPSKTLDLDGLVLEVADKYDATWYLQRKTFEEKASLLYRFLRDEGYSNLLDIGANVGLISILARRACPELNIVAVEADPRLARILRRNFERHGLEGAHVVNAIAGAEDLACVEFSLNPSSTLDNRVQVAAWPKVRVPMVRLGGLVERLSLRGKTFIKVDTQGFELHVLKGLETFLMSDTGWLLKMEFAPNWLRSQGTDPGTLLDHLQLRYEFAEYPERIPFGTAGLEALFARPINFRKQAEFLTHVVAQNRNGLGWVDLIVRPKPVVM